MKVQMQMDVPCQIVLTFETSAHTKLCITRGQADNLSRANDICARKYAPKATQESHLPSDMFVVASRILGVQMFENYDNKELCHLESWIKSVCSYPHNPCFLDLF